VINKITTVIIFASLVGCGVKGDPLPPDEPVPIGRGRPTFQDSRQKLAYPELPPVKTIDKDSKDKEDSGDESF
jgi:hypothetical protein